MRGSVCHHFAIIAAVNCSCHTRGHKLNPYIAVYISLPYIAYPCMASPINDPVRNMAYKAIYGTHPYMTSPIQIEDPHMATYARMLTCLYMAILYMPIYSIFFSIWLCSCTQQIKPKNCRGAIPLHMTALAHQFLFKMTSFLAY